MSRRFAWLGAAGLLAGCAASTTDRPPTSEGASATMACDDGTLLAARFSPDGATVTREGRTATLADQRPASGMWYKGADMELRGKGREATLTTPAGATQCRELEAPPG